MGFVSGTIWAAALTSLACASSLDLVIVFDRTEPSLPPGSGELVSAIQSGLRVAVASTEPESRVHTPLTGDAAAIERAVEDASAAGGSRRSRRPQLYRTAVRSAELFDNGSPAKRAVLFITFNREKPSEKRTRELIELYRKQAIRLEVIVLPFGTGSQRGVRGGVIGPLGGVFCDPGPACPPLRYSIQPDLRTLDGIAAATGGSVWRIRADERIDWHRLIDEMGGGRTTTIKADP
jgi:hypothetical protein